jgi:glyoxylase-like metal-dependent hydrolase (beta-lactamase superfamily II)
MIFKQFNFDGCLAYVMACERERKGVIIDPSHEMDPFLDFVASRGLTITHIIDTHTHVDHVSLAPELADRLTAKTVMNRKHRRKESWGQRSRTSSASKRSWPRTP